MWRSSATAFRVIPYHTRFKRFNSSKSSSTNTNNKTVRKRTKKNYSDLPTSYTLEDGSVATALAPLVAPSFAAPIDSGSICGEDYPLGDVGLVLQVVSK